MGNINIDTLDAVLDRYLEHLESTRRNERYKWEAVKHFQKTFDLSADDVPAMLRDAFQVDRNPKLNLIYARAWNPVGMLELFFWFDSRSTLDALERLFDESVDLRNRMVAFEAWAVDILARHNEQRRAKGESPAKSHWQDTRSMSVYLSFKSPELHYLYKTNMYREAAELLGTETPGDKFDKVIKYRKMCEQILARIKETHPALIEASDATLRDTEVGDLTQYDPAYHLLVQDVIYYITTYDKNYRDEKNSPCVQTDDKWFPSDSDYHPGIDADGWEELLRDGDVFTNESLVMMSRFRAIGGSATCTQLARRYGETKNYYNTNSVFLAKRVQRATGCPTMSQDNEKSKWWPILYKGCHAEGDVDGSYIWRLREELAEALERVELPDPESKGESAPPIARRHWWAIASPAQTFRFGNLAVGGVEPWCLFNENGHRRLVAQNFLDAREGDLVVGYESSPVKQVVALGRISAEQDGTYLYFQKTEGLEHPVDYATLKAMPELENMEYFRNQRGSFFKLTENEYEAILDVVRESNPSKPVEHVAEAYTRDDFLSQVYMTEERYDRLEALLRRKKNVILQGAPGTGKTFCARRLAWSMMGCRDNRRIEMVQFHQSYSYEDFVEGWRPTGDGFELRHGIFHRFCQRAANHPDQEFFFIIDEINRGNVSKVFGELLMLIEADHRGEQVTLAYDGQIFSVPRNLYIIGMMNTADRSLAGIDYALRRRFSFFEMEPAYGSTGFAAYQRSLESEELDALVDQIRALNVEIMQDPTLGRGYRIGHSYLCGQEEAGEDWLRGVIEYDIVPMLEEYWFEDPGKAARWEGLLLGAISQ